MFICMSTQIYYEWGHENDVNCMGEVAPASAMLILPIDGLSNPNVRNMKYEIWNTKWSNYRLRQNDKMYKQLNENEMKSGFWSCMYDMTRIIKWFDPMIAK